MPELPPQSPGEPAPSAFINDVALRTAQRYSDTAQRDTLDPTPEDGQLAFVDTATEGRFVLQVYASGVWQTMVSATTGQIVTIDRSSTNMIDLHNAAIASNLQPSKVRVRVSEVTGFTVQTGSKDGAVPLSNALELQRDNFKILGIGGARIGIERDGVAFQWRFAVGSSGDLLLQSSPDGTAWTTQETWIGT